MSNRTRQENKRGECKVESNDSPEIPDMGETSDIPGLPSGAINHKISHDTNLHKTYTNIEHKIFEELVPSVSPLLKKHIRLGHAGIVDPYV